jgi:cytochrome c
MKKIILLLTATLCFGYVQVSAQKKAKKTVIKSKKITPVIEEGKVLISKSDCLSCHRPAIKLIGPSFHDIALKYPSSTENFQFLTDKIIKGGSGSWGPVPMSPHTQLSKTQVEKMVTYILSFK